MSATETIATKHRIPVGDWSVDRIHSSVSFSVTYSGVGTFRGGFYVDTVLNGPGCLYATTAHDTAHLQQCWRGQACG